MRRPVLIALALVGAVLTALFVVWRLRGEDHVAVVTPDAAPDLGSMTRDELYTLARERDIPGRSKMNKSALIAALSRA